MIRPWHVAVVAILLASPALAATVNVNTTTSSVYSDRITEVEVDSVGTYTFPDPFTAPTLTQQSEALDAALVGLGVPMGTVANAQGTLSIGSDQTQDTVVTSNYNPIDNPDYVVGDPEDYLTWIAIGDEDVNVSASITTTYYTFHRLLADIPPDCAPGSFSATGQEPCTSCLPGSYQPSAGQASCVNCAAGSFAASAGASTCTHCDAGSFSAEGSAMCTGCSPGTFSDLPGASGCSNCAAGSFAASIGSASCTSCGSGTYSPAGSATCYNCSAGTFSSGGAGSCSSCGAGTFSPPAAGSCTPCAAGTFASVMGQAECTDCGAGTFELDPGSAACDPCPGGQATPCNDNGTCSDGPTGNGTCSCDAGYTGSACENFSATTTTTSTTSTTLPAGPCAAVPETGCVVATKAVLQIQANSNSAENKLKWKLVGGSLAVEQMPLGDPAASTSWILCIYDSTLDLPFLTGFLTVGPSASLWKSKDPKGWVYKDKRGSQDGVTGVVLKSGPAGKPKAQLKAAGSSLPLPLPVNMTKYFDQNPTVTVQLRKDGGPGGDLCWTSEFDASGTKLNTPVKFKATAK